MCCGSHVCGMNFADVCTIVRTRAARMLTRERMRTCVCVCMCVCVCVRVRVRVRVPSPLCCCRWLCAGVSPPMFRWCLHPSRASEEFRLLALLLGGVFVRVLHSARRRTNFDKLLLLVWNAATKEGEPVGLLFASKRGDGRRVVADTFLSVRTLGFASFGPSVIVPLTASLEG